MQKWLVTVIVAAMACGLAGYGMAGDNVFDDGDMERVRTIPGENPDLPAVPAENAPPGWSASPADAVSVVSDAHSGKFAIKLSSQGKSTILNYFLPTMISDGVISFFYKINSEVKKGNLIFYAISWKNTEMDPRASVAIPLSDADGKWHKASFRFNFKTQHQAIVLAPRMSGEGADNVTADWIIDDIEVRELDPALAVNRVFADKVIALVGDDVGISAEITNSGGGTLEKVKVTLSGADAGVSGAKPFEYEEIRATKVEKSEWTVKAAKPGMLKITVQVSAPGFKTVKAKINVPVIEKYPEIAKIYEIPAGAIVTQDYACFSNAKLRLYFPKTKDGFGPGFLYLKRDGWGLAGVTGLPHYAIVETKEGGMEYVSGLSQKATAAGGEALALEAAIKDDGGTLWKFEYRITPADKDKVLLVSAVSPDKDAGFFHFRGPWLSLGTGSFGTQRKMALFSGVEYLTPEEQSSNYLFHSPPDDLRFAPPAYMPTVPLIAVETPLGLVSILWSQVQAWADGESYPRSYFGSPNRFEKQDNTTMGLFAMSNADKRKPNILVSTAPFKLKKGNRLRLEAALFASTAGNILDAQDEWITLFGIPPMPAGRSFDEELKWMGEKTGIVWPSLRAEIGSATGSARKSMKSQNPDGSWGYVPNANAIKYYKDPNVLKMQEEKRKLVGNPDAFTFDWYGKPGDKACGISAWELLNVLKGALYTGDTEFLESGIRGLEYVRKNFVRPEGAQVWEIPLHAPDILPSGMLPECFILAYRATGDKTYLDDAVFWARTGINFVYLWSAPDRKAMAFATIPIIGSTLFNGSWTGVPVLWCGMWYARGILYLSKYDNSRPWRQIGEGITRCCMQQQVYYGDPKKGRWFCYPDVWNILDDNYGGADINPGDITRNIRIMNDNPEIASAVLQFNNQKVIVCTEARIKSFGAIADGIRIDLGDGPANAHVSVSRTVTVKAVRINGAEVPAVENYTDTGFRKLSGNGVTFINAAPNAVVEIVISQ